MRTPVRDLAGKNVFVTGAASGIGRAVASAAAREGAVLFLTDVDAQRLLATVEDIRTSAGEVAYAAPADISDHDAVRAMAAESHRHAAHRARRPARDRTADLGVLARGG